MLQLFFVWKSLEKQTCWSFQSALTNSHLGTPTTSSITISCSPCAKASALNPQAGGQSTRFGERVELTEWWPMVAPSVLSCHENIGAYRQQEDIGCMLMLPRVESPTECLMPFCPLGGEHRWTSAWTSAKDILKIWNLALQDPDIGWNWDTCFGCFSMPTQTEPGDLLSSLVSDGHIASGACKGHFVSRTSDCQIIWNWMQNDANSSELAQLSRIHDSLGLILLWEQLIA